MLVVLPLEKFAIALGEYASATENVADKPSHNQAQEP
jgi:hypothetical protein